MSDNHEAQPREVGASGIPARFVYTAAFVFLLTSVMWWWLCATTTNTLICMLFTGVAIVLLWLLWIMPSEANELNGGEVFVGILVLVVGILFGSSPPARPFLAWAWQKAGMGNTSPLASPTKDMWTWSEEQKILLPTAKVPEGMRLVVIPSNQRHGIFVEAKGVPLASLKGVEIFLQHLANERTSSSVLIEAP